MVAHCKNSGISGAILSIDQAKAFDSVSHIYMHYVYEFFGFGPEFIRLMETLGNNRTACIAFEDGSFSAEINLECGRAQGNTSSPVEYNMAEQILLFTIKLCPEIQSVYINHFIERPYLPLPLPQPEMAPINRIWRIRTSGMNLNLRLLNLIVSLMTIRPVPFWNMVPFPLLKMY
jgi:hypothetical protein